MNMGKTKEEHIRSIENDIMEAYASCHTSTDVADLHASIYHLAMQQMEYTMEDITKEDI